MFLFGKERGFKKTVLAIIELGKIAPHGDISRLGEVMSGEDTAQTMETGAKIICALNKAYEQAEHLRDSDHKEEPLTLAQVESLDYQVFADLLVEAMDAFNDSPKIEAEPKKKEGKARR